jgi:hypothetical protein
MEVLMFVRSILAFALLVLIGDPSSGKEPRPFNPPAAVPANDHEPRRSNVIEVKPQGEFAQIDTRGTIDVMKRLNSSDRATKAKAVEQVKTSPGKIAPPALYVLSNVLFQQGQKEDALFWYYLGQLRARSDANKCNDISARQAVTVLNGQYGPPINKYAFRNTKVNYKKNVQDIRALATKVVEWDRKHDREYDPRWIALHGMGAFTDNKPAFEPKSRWSKINEQTRVEYLKGLDEATEMFRKMDRNGDGAVSDAEIEADQKREQAEMEARVKREVAETAKELKQRYPPSSVKKRK